MATNYSNNVPTKDGYLARFQEKLTPKPNIKQYTIKDYRELKNNIEYKEAHDTGKLGFDPSNETYQKKAEIEAKKREYAEKVKERNRLLINEKARANNNQTRSSITSTAKSNVRPKSISPLGCFDETEMENKTLVRIRDPVTGQIKKMYINDKKKKELKEDQKLNKVHSFVGHQSRVSVRSDVMSSHLMNDFYRQEHVQEFAEKEDYERFVKDVDGPEIADDNEQSTNTMIVNEPELPELQPEPESEPVPETAAEKKAREKREKEEQKAREKQQKEEQKEREKREKEEQKEREKREKEEKKNKK